MTKQDAIDWIKDNLPTKEVDGEMMVALEHDTDGETVCTVCDRPHTPTTEIHPVASLAEKYEESIIDGDPVAEAKNQNSGHERFFEQA